MHFCAIHLDDRPADDDEEVYVVVPGAAKAVMAVPLDTLDRFLVLLEQAVGSEARPQCRACGTAIPGSVPMARSAGRRIPG
jgi:hypothetical protein